ncbi:MAG: TonB-dependent receptor [Myxococcota bacterium]
MVRKFHETLSFILGISRLSAIGLQLAIGALPFTAAAANDPGEDDDDSEDVEILIVTGTEQPFGEKSGIPLSKIPQGVQVIDAEELIARDVKSIGEALRVVPSANVGTPRTAAYQSFSLTIRGFLADQMRNGVRQRYYEDVDASALSNIERLEVLKGPSSVLYGQSALGGIVSIVTKQPKDEFSATLSAVGGSYRRAAMSFDVTGPITDTLALRLNGELERSDTFVDFQDLVRENLAFSALWTPTSSFEAHLNVEWTSRRTLRYPGLPASGTLTTELAPELPRDRFLAEPDQDELLARAPLIQAWADIALADGWTLTPRFSMSGFRTRFTQIRVLETDADGVTVNRNGRYGSEDDLYTIGQLDLTGTLHTGPLRHHVLVGVELDIERATFDQENIVDEDGNTLVPPINAANPEYGLIPQRPFAFGFALESDIDGLAVYAQDRIVLFDDLSVIVGGRWSRFDVSSAFSVDPIIDAEDIIEDDFDYRVWQAGGTYALTPQFSFFGGYATGFDIENVAGSRDIDGAPLQPEESEQLEAGTRLDFGSLRSSVSGFRIRRKNLANDDPQNPGFSIQTGEVRAQGFEMEAEVAPVKSVRVQMGYAFLDNEITSSTNGDEGDAVPGVARHQANAFVRWFVPSTDLELRGGVYFVGDRAFSSARVDVAPGVAANELELDAYVTMDVGAAYTWSLFRLDAAVTNVTSTRYYTTENAFNNFAVLPGAPLQASLRLTATF